ncbi:MAG: pyridoxal-dependent decarboxylase [Planctomycetota bacterium]
MDPETFRRHGHEVIDWVADYLANVERYPVLAPVSPGEVRARLPSHPPAQGEPMERLLADFREIILPGVTHWNHPCFFAYFPANNSGPSILGELLSAALGINAMLWQTCPAATELEERVLEWLRQMLELPAAFRGVIQDTASTASICALLCARERLTGFAVNARGFRAAAEGGDLRIYVSREGHSSIEKGAKITGFGAQNVVRVGVDANYALDPEDLERHIVTDREAGHRPCCIVATVGTTSSTAIDPLGPIGEIAEKYNLWLHVDAALAGSAAILPEKRWILNGIERVDSFVFNPHKWLLTNFDCSAYFTRDPHTLIATLTIAPEYLRTDLDQEVTNYRDWGLQLGRRFRALKLWFVLRHYGADGLRRHLREHIRLADDFRRSLERSGIFEVLAPVPLNTVCFRFHPPGASEAELERLNKALQDEVNGSGRIYLTQTRLDGRYTLRLSVGQTATRRHHLEKAWECLRTAAVVRSWKAAPP